MFFSDDIVGDVQSLACTFADFLGGKKLVEYVVSNVLGDSCAVVRYAYLHPVLNAACANGNGSLGLGGFC